MERKLPDKAIDLIDEAASKHVIEAEASPPEVRDLKERLDEAQARLDAAAQREDFEEAARVKQEVMQVQTEYQQRVAEWRAERGISEEVTEQDIASLIAQMTGIPVDKMLEGEAEKLLNMEEGLHGRVVGQDAAIVALSRRHPSRAQWPQGPATPHRLVHLPRPHRRRQDRAGEGARRVHVRRRGRDLRLDMSEYQERHTVSRLVGAPPGYVGYDEARWPDGGGAASPVPGDPLRRDREGAPGRVQHAAPDPGGRAADRLARPDGGLPQHSGHPHLEPRHRREAHGPLGFQARARTDAASVSHADRNVEDALKQAFRPEFLNRIDEIIVFEPLTEVELTQIADLLLDEVRERLLERHVDFEVTERAKQALVQEGYEPAYGARPLRRTIQRRVENALAKRVLSGEFSEGDRVIVDLDGAGEYTFARAEVREGVTV